jgi:hypothetical protein
MRQSGFQSRSVSTGDASSLRASSLVQAIQYESVVASFGAQEQKNVQRTEILGRELAKMPA